MTEQCGLNKSKFLLLLVTRNKNSESIMPLI